jgi:hypothetical protein
MKNILYFSIMICTSLLLLISCEKSPDQFSIKFVPGNEQISNRTTESCEDCPNGCCCCNITLVNPISTVSLSLCGVCEGDYLCGTFSPPSPCSSVSGQGEDIQFTQFILRRVFCVPEGGSFRIFNNENFPVTISFTCQHDILDPDTHNITIPMHSSVFFVSDGECFVEGPCI